MVKGCDRVILIYGKPGFGGVGKVGEICWQQKCYWLMFLLSWLMNDDEKKTIVHKQVDHGNRYAEKDPLFSCQKDI